jgi:propanol-preferring alcohol dehydrogenase
VRALRLVAKGEPLVEAALDPGAPASDQAIVRVLAAGICHSDVHYQQGDPRLPPLPRVLGHEIAGIVDQLGSQAPDGLAVGQRVGVHYQISCGACGSCLAGNDQFCTTGSMIGNHVDGGYAELVKVPARNLVAIPAAVEAAHAAVMMCSSATVFHALRKARLAGSESVAVFGLGGLGQSAVQLAFALGAGRVFGVDLNPVKLDVAAGHGAETITGGDGAVSEILAAGGADVALELVGSQVTMRQAIEVLRPFGRAMAIGLANQPTEFMSYDDLVMKEAEIIGVSDHLRTELPELLAIAAGGGLDLSDVVTAEVPLAAGPVNQALADLAGFGDEVRTVITPGA